MPYKTGYFMKLVLSQQELDEISALQEAFLAPGRLANPGYVRGLLVRCRRLAGAMRSFAVFPGREAPVFVNDGTGPQIEAYLKTHFSGFDKAGNIVLTDPELEEINRRRRQMGAGVHHEGRLKARALIEKSGYFREAFAPAGMHHVIGLSCPLQPGEAVFAFGYAGADDPGFSGARTEPLLRLLLPAFCAGFLALAARTANAVAVERALPRLPAGAAVLREPPPVENGAVVVPGPPLPDADSSWIALPSGTHSPRALLSDAGARHGLTARQVDVAALMLDGCTTPEIAETLGISRHTARRHCENLMARLGVRSRSALWRRLSCGHD